MTAASTGGNGDICYSIPCMKQLGVTDVYLPAVFYQMMSRFLQSQGFTVHSFPAICPPVDYVMDDFRQQPLRGKNHIMYSIAQQFKTKFDKTPWLKIPPHPDLTGPYTVVHLTGRWREGSRVDWKRVRAELVNPVFIGLQHEWSDFCYKYGDIKWFPTEDIYEFAQVIAGSEALYCNQSVSLTIAQGLGKKYYLEVKPRKTNTLLYTPNENIL